MVWDACATSLTHKNPAPDLQILDVCRTGELPSRWPEVRGRERKRQRLQAEWEMEVDRLGIPAWDMGATFSQGNGIADTYTLDQIPMYFGSNGVLYIGAGSKTPGGTYTGDSTYRTPDGVPDVWNERWGAWRTIDNRQEIANGFANLVVKHDLPIAC